MNKGVKCKNSTVHETFQWQTVLLPRGTVKQFFMMATSIARRLTYPPCKSFGKLHTAFYFTAEAHSDFSLRQKLITQ